MKKKVIIVTIIAIILLLLLIIAIKLIPVKGNNKETQQPLATFKYFEDDNNYQLYLKGAEINKSKIYKITDTYTIEIKFTNLVGEELTYEIYVNNKKLTSAKMVDYTNSEFDVEDFYLYGETLFYPQNKSYKKEELKMYFIEDTNIYELPTIIDNSDIKLSGFIANKNHLTIEYSRLYENFNYMYKDKIYNLCNKLPKGFKDNTIMQEYYNYELKDNKLNKEPLLYSKYTYKEFIKEEDIVCE